MLYEGRRRIRKYNLQNNNKLGQNLTYMYSQWGGLLYIKKRGNRKMALWISILRAILKCDYFWEIESIS